MGLAPGTALVPAQQGAQRHESCASIRDPGEQCGPDLCFTQRIATAMHFVPARRAAARPCACPRTAGELRAAQVPSPLSGIPGAICGLFSRYRSFVAR
jgi:hypothetical protein